MSVYYLLLTTEEPSVSSVTQLWSTVSVRYVTDISVCSVTHLWSVVSERYVTSVSVCSVSHLWSVVSVRYVTSVSVFSVTHLWSVVSLRYVRYVTSVSVCSVTHLWSTASVRYVTYVSICSVTYLWSAVSVRYVTYISVCSVTHLWSVVSARYVTYVSVCSVTHLWSAVSEQDGTPLTLEQCLCPLHDLQHHALHGRLLLKQVMDHLQQGLHVTGNTIVKKGQPDKLHYPPVLLITMLMMWIRTSLHNGSEWFPEKKQTRVASVLPQQASVNRVDRPVTWK